MSKPMEFSAWVKKNSGMTGLLWDMSVVHFKSKLIRHFIARRDQIKTRALEQAWRFLTIANGEQNEEALQLAHELAKVHRELEEAIAHIKLELSAPNGVAVAEIASNMLRHGHTGDAEKKKV